MKPALSIFFIIVANNFLKGRLPIIRKHECVLEIQKLEILKKVLLIKS